MKLFGDSASVLRTIKMRSRGTCVSICCSVLLGAFPISAFAAAASAPVHGLWVWKSPTVLAAPRAAEALEDFCKSQGINEVYVSVSSRSAASEEKQLAHLISLLHRSDIRVEALLSSTDADEPGKHRETLLDHVREIVRFNQEHPTDRFDGIHLDVEPQQRPENKGTGNLGFLPGLADAFQAVRAVAEPAGLRRKRRYPEQTSQRRSESTKDASFRSAAPHAHDV